MVLLKLECAAQKYAWGKIGLESTVAQLVDAQGGAIESDSPYAELWMGTHPNGPSSVILEDGTKLLLSEYLEKNPEALGQGADPADGLPYLFKILSVNTALSIQAHPDKGLAEKLHADRPQVYKDPNHKPEMACAITPFEALAGFMKLEEVVSNIEATPELKTLLLKSDDGKSALEDAEKLASQDEETQKQVLKLIFSALMKSDVAQVEDSVASLEKRLASVSDLQMPDALALRLCGQYPGDVGVFCAYIMCYRVLEPGQAVFLGANEPHAYLAGDCAEIMACSDNVVRAGLTPKLRDVDTLVSMLTYRQPNHSGAEFHPGNMLEGKVLSKNSTLYGPPDPAVTEFQMERLVVSSDDGKVDLTPSSFACILIVLEGSGTVGSVPVKLGDIFLQPANSQDQLSCADGSNLVAFRATLKGAF